MTLAFLKASNCDTLFSLFLLVVCAGDEKEISFLKQQDRERVRERVREGERERARQRQ